jgi:DNA mismatch repair protein MutL
MSMNTPVPVSAILAGAEVSYSPETNIQDELPFQQQNNFQTTSFNENREIIPEIKPELIIPDNESFQNSNNDQAAPPLPETNKEAFPHREEETSGSQQLTDNIKILAFLDETYILGANNSGLVIIDQHAAHERILFEKFMKNAENNSPNSQKLLIPVTLELSKSEFQFLKKNRDAFQAVGFDVEPFGNNTVIISAFPAELKCGQIAETFGDILHSIIENEKKSHIDKAEIAKAACKKAVKAHDKLSLSEAEALIHQMQSCILPYSCPHGRPTIISISYKELEKRFGRI